MDGLCRLCCVVAVGGPFAGGRPSVFHRSQSLLVRWGDAWGCGGWRAAQPRLRGRPSDGASCSRRAGLQQCKSFVEMCIVSCLSASPACVCGLVSSTWDCPRRRLPLRSRAVAGVSLHVCVCLGPVLASHAPSPTVAAAAAWRGRGLVPIAGWICG